MSTRLQVLVPKVLDVRLRNAAEQSRVSKSEWVRRAIERALTEDRAAADPVSALAGRGAPTADIEQMLKEIEAGRA